MGHRAGASAAVGVGKEAKVGVGVRIGVKVGVAGWAGAAVGVGDTHANAPSAKSAPAAKRLNLSVLIPIDAPSARRFVNAGARAVPVHDHDSVPPIVERNLRTIRRPSSSQTTQRPCVFHVIEIS